MLQNQRLKKQFNNELSCDNTVLQKIQKLSMITKSKQLMKIFRYTKNLRFSFFQTKLTEERLKDLKVQYKVTPTLKVFKEYITNNSDYFKIFQVVQRETYSPEAYSQLKEETAKLPQNDNMLLLRARIISRIAQNQAKVNHIKEADQLFNEAIQILQQSLVPQVLQYYTIYRQYGFFLQSIDQKQKALQVLSQSVEIMRQYVKMSEDAVTANYHSIQQAKACVKLIYLQPQQREKWLKLANEYWRQCQKGVHQQIQYAQTVYENSMEKKKINEKKARLYAEVEMDKINNEKYNEIILKAFESKKN